MLQQLLEDVLADHASKCGVWDLLDELSDLPSAVSQFIDKFVGVDGSVVNNGFNLHGDVVFGDNLLRRHAEDGGLHIYLNHTLADGVDDVEAWLEDLEIPSKGLVDSYFGCFDLVDRWFAAAADTRRPYLQTTCKGTAALQAGLVASALKVLALEVLEVLLVVVADDLVVGLGHCYII